MKDKIKKVFKVNTKFISGLILGLLLPGVIYGANAYEYDASNVKYNNDESGFNSTTVEGALKELKQASKICSGYDVNIEVENGTIVGNDSDVIKKGEEGTFEVKPNPGYGGGTIECTNGHTGTLEGTTLTTSDITNDTTCKVTFQKTYIVNVTINNGSIASNDTPSKEIVTGKTGTFELNPNTSYGNGTVSCTNNQTATLSGNTLTTGAITGDTTCTVSYVLLSRTVTVNVTNGTPTTQNKTVNVGESATFTVTPNTNYGGGDISCTNGQTATLSGNTLTTGTITSDTTCTVTYQTGPSCSGTTCAYGQSCKTGYYSTYECGCSSYSYTNCIGGYEAIDSCVAVGQSWDGCASSLCDMVCTSPTYCGGGSYNYCG